MSDEQSTPAAADETGAADETDEADSGDALEPNGGPQRVVSEESVDDILDSLDATKSASANAASADSSTSETVTTTTAEADSGSETGADESPDPDSSDDESPDSAEASFDEPGSSDESTESDESDPEPSAVDSAAASLPDDIADESPEDLAARVERGDVTGADVRAAEAGEDRESTPEIDDVDLSMDDLETTQAGGPTGDANVPDDADPLAGSVDPDDGPATGDDEDDSPGLLGRIKRFFSR
ncbi:hypothetical protein [Natrinema versiforme]|uniref:Uncharacterized protein n=1 Tax=Natrinema versiforme JCM 10478 TaxID=1227496 RepID=L9Y0Q5_9EURY|nr:hypothetical protein [Natrinema versiforme]ELY67271.1 hypothetical protein C489_10928 [Natrinema versiforme JCM 10478]